MQRRGEQTQAVRGSDEQPRVDEWMRSLSRSVLHAGVGGEQERTMNSTALIVDPQPMAPSGLRVGRLFATRRRGALVWPQARHAKCDQRRIARALDNGGAAWRSQRRSIARQRSAPTAFSRLQAKRHRLLSALLTGRGRPDRGRQHSKAHS